ncbi:hypothetical protein AJ80_05771 [Polytolypa hystricis UAMH7299]|uniref:Uncharacterized protein n=1 Tax=Polytolypa hystricis (strain UAMH7299) TaxID=1447883 RepID=A0A2B7Y0X5_POLH7|nr:hypothetical protein AJ80_05771 [Polytolypa hystricis UAMH7299]
MSMVSANAPSTTHAHSARYAGDAATAANLVTRSRSIGSKVADVDASPTSISSRDEYKLATAGAAATLAFQAAPGKHGASHVNAAQPQLNSLGSKAAYHASREQPTAASYATKSGQTEKYLSDPYAKRAASGAASSSRRRAESAPADPKASRSLPYAISAATASQKPVHLEEPISEEPELLFDPATVHNVAVANARRKLQTEPTGDTEVDEKRREGVRHASAISMAQQMWAVMPKVSERLETVEEHAVFGRPGNLHLTAQRLASERLAQLRDEQQEFLDYYQSGLQLPPRSTGYLGIRRRASSEGDAGNLDQEQSRRIRSEMTALQRKAVGMKDRKRAEDQAALIAAARKNVGATMNAIDEDIFVNSGKPPQDMVDDWEDRFNKRLRADREAKAAGGTVGGEGELAGYDNVEDVAKERLQPTLTDLHQTAEAEQARILNEKLDENHRWHWFMLDKEREAGRRADQKMLKKMEKEKKSRGISDIFRPKKDKGKSRAIDDQVEASGAAGAVTEFSTYDRELEETLDGVSESENAPPTSHVMHETAGEPSNSSSTSEGSLSSPGSGNRILGGSKDAQDTSTSEPQRRRSWLGGRGRQPSHGSETSKTAGAGGLFGRSRSAGEATEPKAQEQPVPKPPPTELAETTPAPASSEQQPTASAVAPQPENTDRLEVPSGGPRQWSTSTEGAPRTATGGQERPVRTKPKRSRWSFRDKIFGRPSSPTRSPGAFEVQRPTATAAEGGARQGESAAGASGAAPSSPPKFSKFQENL